MPSRDQLQVAITSLFDRWVTSPDDAWVAIYRLLLDYAGDVLRITDANRLSGPGKTAWLGRAALVEGALAAALKVTPAELPSHVSVLMRNFYRPGQQGHNQVGIGLACAVVDLIDRFAPTRYRFMKEARIGRDIFPTLTTGHRQAVDVAVFKGDVPFAAISSKWGVRHDRIRDPQEEADTYKQHIPGIHFFVVTNEFDNGRLQQLIKYPTIDGVYHVHSDLVRQCYPGRVEELAPLRDLTDLISFFTSSSGGNGVPSSSDPSSGQLRLDV